ncbi:hypothetical protein DFS33DRAFT_803784 [Desarmillaria ectypa]|nr:hypothetical protein DFS33DRAFT_803784 [Desarmillaria ectypa]
MCPLPLAFRLLLLPIRATRRFTHWKSGLLADNLDCATAAGTWQYVASIEKNSIEAMVLSHAGCVKISDVWARLASTPTMQASAQVVLSLASFPVCSRKFRHLSWPRKFTDSPPCLSVAFLHANGPFLSPQQKLCDTKLGSVSR